MGGIFLKILNMSIAASWLILAVMLLRFVLKKAPKWITVLLWGIVALRLAVPFSFESALSLIPSAETFNAHNIQYETPAISSGIPAVNNAVNPVLGETFAPNSVGSINPLYIWTLVVSAIWLVGIAAMLLYAVISYVRVRQSVAERAPYEGNIFLCDHVKSPFILGLVRPKIYLPSSMDEAAMGPVIAHEKAHLARHDHWWKPLGFLILAVHWFNPLCWAAYVLLCQDIELACDEKVIRQMDLDGKKQYSTALLECSTQRRLVTICPLAFGEVGVKERVKNVLNYKKPAFWVIVAAVIACAVVTVCFATNPEQDLSQERHTVQARITKVEDGSFLVTPVEGSQELSSGNLFRVPITNMPPSPEPQVGDIVEIIYNGFILESYPGQFGTIYSMRVISQENSLEIDELRVKYPEYFELGTFKGLEVYVWQMAENDYRFGLMQGTNREKTLDEKMALKGATAKEMALILSTYDIEDKNIFVIPWPNPISSYMVTEDTVNDPKYISNIRAMLGLDKDSTNSTEIDGAEAPKLTLDDVVMLSQKGDALTWSDFEQYQGREVGSGLYIMRYGIDELFDVLVGGVPSETPMYIELRVNADDSVDMRTGDVSAFIEAHKNDVPAQPDFATLFDKQTAIRQAILEHNRSANPTGLVSCASFVELACVVADGNDFSQYTYYGWALYEAYKVTDDGLEAVAGKHIPVVLSFNLKEEDYMLGYTLTEYWEPRDGGYYVQDVREKFPAHIVEDGMDSQKFIRRQTQECYAQAVASTGLDTDQVIGALVETICSSPALSSNPGNYIEAHPIEYRELTYYGRYTLKYCFARFEEGGKTGLEGQVMMRICEDIAIGWGEEGLRMLVCEPPTDGVLTGQMWYNAFKNNALSLMEQYSEIELAGRYPASYLLLSMLGKV